MPKYSVTVSMTRKVEGYARDEDEAGEKACEIVMKWSGILDASAEDVEQA